MDGEDLIGALQGEGVGGREFSDTGRAVEGVSPSSIGMERHDFNAAAVRERGGRQARNR